jgi:transcriptional regulator with XRE-family HTH domain
MPESFGTRLRQRREAQAISLEAIAEQTKIKRSLFDALERDDVSRWPSGIFRRAYIRAYACAIALDPDLVVREFLEVHPEKAEVVEPLPAMVAATTGRPPTPPRALGQILGTAAGALSRFRRRPAAEGHAGDDENVAADRASMDDRPGSPDPDFLAVAHLCTELGRAERTSDVQRLVPRMATILHASGLIVWVWDPLSSELRAALMHGYSSQVLAQLPSVTRDSDNATAAAFRSAQPCAVRGSGRTSGALTIPLLTPAGCAGVLALEREPGCEQTEAVLAAATIFAAILAQLVADPQATGESS